MPEQNQAAKDGGEQPRVERLTRNETGQLVLHVAGRAEPYVDVQVVRCFPWSCPDSYVALRELAGKEIVLVKSLDELDQASREMVQSELRDKVFNPRIRRIVDHKRQFGLTSITAETDRGTVTFQVPTRDDVRILSSSRALFRDADGNVYEVADLSALDPESRKHLSEYF